MINNETKQAVKVAQLLGELFTELSTICGQFAQQGGNVQEITNKVEETLKEVAPLKEVPQGTVIDEATETEEVEEELSMEEQLRGLSMRDLRELAKSKGLKLSGKKDELIARLLNEETEVEDEVIEDEILDQGEETEDIIEEDEVQDEELVEEDEEAIDNVIEEVEEEETLSDRITRELEGYSDDEIKEILEGVEMSTKGKRQALISRVVEAVEQGLLEFEADEEDIEPTDYEEVMEVEDFEEVVEDDEEIIEDEEEDDYEEEQDEEVELSAREEAQARIKEGIQLRYSKKQLTDKEIAKFLDTHFNGRFQAKDKKRALAKYMEIFAELVDEDGEVHGFADPYYVEEAPFCCGAELSELDNHNLYCEHCGNEYETE